MLENTALLVSYGLQSEDLISGKTKAVHTPGSKMADNLRSWSLAGQPPSPLRERLVRVYGLHRSHRAFAPNADQNMQATVTFLRSYCF